MAGQTSPFKIVIDDIRSPEKKHDETISSCSEEEDIYDDNCAESINNDSLELSVIESFTKRNKTLKRVRLMSESSTNSDEDDDHQNPGPFSCSSSASTSESSHNVSPNNDVGTRHTVDKETSKISSQRTKQSEARQTITTLRSVKDDGDNLLVSDGQPPVVRKYKFRKIQRSTSSASSSKTIHTPPPKQHSAILTKENYTSNKNRGATKIEIYNDVDENSARVPPASKPSNNKECTLSSRDCLFESILCTPRGSVNDGHAKNKPSIDSILEGDLSFSIDGIDSTLFDQGISPCVLSQHSTHSNNISDKNNHELPTTCFKNTTPKCSPTKVSTNVTPKRGDNLSRINTSPISPISPFGSSLDKRYKQFRRTFRHYSPVRKRPLRNLENISLDSDVIWPTP